MKKVVYSCITGGYDKVPVHKYVAPDWDYVLFTDNQKLIKRGKYAHWTIRPALFNKLSSAKNSRWYKANPHILFPEYDYSLWLDANIIVNNENLFRTIDKLIKHNCLIAIPNHPVRNCAYEEAKIIKKYGIDYPETVNREMAFLRREKYPDGNGLTENCIILRKHNDIKPALDLWWEMIEKYSKRDQLSLNYALWKTGVKNTPIYTGKNGLGIHHETPDITFVYGKNHNQGKTQTNKIKIPLWLRIICLFIPNSNIRHALKHKYEKARNKRNKNA